MWPFYELIDIVRGEELNVSRRPDQIRVLQDLPLQIEGGAVADQAAQRPLRPALFDVREHLIKGVVDQPGIVRLRQNRWIAGAVGIDLLLRQLDRERDRGLPERGIALGDDREQQHRARSPSAVQTMARPAILKRHSAA